VGTFGEIGFESTPDGRVLAMARYRDDDGKLRRVKATADTARAAERLLKSRLAKRSHQGGNGELRPDSTFGQLVEVWLEDLDLEDRLAPTTRALYERNMRQLVVPAFENFQLREITVSKVDRFLKAQRQRSYSIAKQSKVVLSLAFGLAVRYEAMPRNPVRETARLSRPAVQAKALSVDEVEAIRRAVVVWRRGEGLSGPRPDGQLTAIIEVMLGTSAHPGADALRPRLSHVRGCCRGHVVEYLVRRVCRAAVVHDLRTPRSGRRLSPCRAAITWLRRHPGRQRRAWLAQVRLRRRSL
jgi:hypothetical protein